MLHEHRQNDHRIFAALRLVNGHGPGQANFVEVRQVIGDAATLKLHGRLLLFEVKPLDDTQVAIEDLPVVVVQ